MLSWLDLVFHQGLHANVGRSAAPSRWGLDPVVPKDSTWESLDPLRQIMALSLGLPRVI